MTSIRWLSFLMLGAGTACTSTRNPPSTPAPVPVISAPESTPPVITSPGSWSFRYTPGSVSYQITRSAVVERVDSLNQREVTANVTHEVFALETTEQGIGFNAVVDTFSTTTQGLIGAVQPVQLPIQLSGSLASDGLSINTHADTARCSPVSTVLTTDLHNLLVTFPAVLSPGVTWTDSVNIQGCQSGVPTFTHLDRSYAVSGEVMFEGKPTILILRTDTTRARGEGGLEQHRVTINAAGTGTAAYYLSPVTGQIAHITLNQALDLGITTTTREYRFKQSLKQDFRLVP
jgi:hypothetical protein